MKARDVTIGHRFGRFLVIGEVRKGNRNSSLKCSCLCDCGNMRFVPVNNLITGKTVSCGCYKRDNKLSIAFGQRMK